jgi:hypothetical protein
MTHSVTAALAHLLAAAGAIARHTGKAYNEALLLGLGGGIGAGCCTFDFAGRPCRRLGFRHRWEDDLRFVRDVLARVGAEPVILEAHGPAGAAKCLEKLLAQGLPVMAWVRLPGRPEPVVVVLGQDGDEALLLDGETDARRIPKADLATARNARPSHKNRLLAVPATPAGVDLRAAVKEALAACADRLLHPPVPALGLEAIPQMPPDDALAAAIETETDGVAFRHMFAAFLDEAAILTETSDLHACADTYRSLADAWNRLANACRSGAAPDSLAPLAAAEITAARQLRAAVPTAHA